MLGSRTSYGVRWNRSLTTKLFVVYSLLCFLYSSIMRTRSHRYCSVIHTTFTKHFTVYNCNCSLSVRKIKDSHGLTYSKYVTQMNLTSLYMHILILVLYNNIVNCCYHAGCQVYTTIVHSKCSSGVHRFHSNRKGKHNVE